MYLCCGDALFDLFVGTSDTTSQNPASLAAHSMTLAGGVGGSPMNVAVGLARLGHHSRYLTNVSSDLFGQRMRAYLDANRIDLSLSPTSPLNTTLAIVETEADGSARYVFYTDNTADVGLLENDLPDQLPDDIRMVQFGSYSTAVEPSASTLLAFAERASEDRIVAYDPNLRLSIEPDIDRWRQTFHGFCGHSRVVKASDEDIASLLGENAEERFVADCFDHGSQLVFVTRGADGASAFAADGRSAHHAGVSVSVVDTVGAGDTFQTAVLHWLGEKGHAAQGSTLQGSVDIDNCLDFAIKAAAVTCTRRGPDMPSLEDLS